MELAEQLWKKDVGQVLYRMIAIEPRDRTISERQTVKQVCPYGWSRRDDVGVEADPTFELPMLLLSGTEMHANRFRRLAEVTIVTTA
jgi:hypothetical protein